MIHKLHGFHPSNSPLLPSNYLIVSLNRPWLAVARFVKSVDTLYGTADSSSTRSVFLASTTLFVELSLSRFSIAGCRFTLVTFQLHIHK